ncbi:DUF445 domain-containing protein [Desulfosporosinus sp. Sb-LF]|uniref:DUF445 domain-containing protein n=1 Tax=Desulfosporosinus sp. Sb-LF TaxID=2560027 RepID=UPI00107FC179|nr:DUF445 domain-containing protein [Desulfosporosinus sp. Sb-LF]TGE33845.1 DUF445 domain-containing protein [Desulfosporosinus sp. Sb-LF]
MNYHKKANVILAAVFLFFLIAALLEHYYPNNFGIRLFYFVSEAALVGGIADWFAVTAIFKKPLGWGYHTALIPRNREKVIEAVASMVQKELLRMDVIRKKIEGIPFVVGIQQYVEKQGGSAYLTGEISGYLRRYVEKQDSANLAEKLAVFLRDKAKGWNLSSKVPALCEWALEHGYIDEGLDGLAEGLWDKAAEGETRRAILDYLEEIKEEKLGNGGSIFRTLMGFVEMSDGLNLDDAADALQVELLLTLRKFKEPKHPLRIALKSTLLNKLAESDQDIRIALQVERWKEDLLAEPLFEEFLETLIQEAINVVVSPATSSEPNALHRTLHPFVERYWDSLQENTALREKINSFIVDTLCKVIQNEHDLIGNIVRETLSAYTDQDLNQFIEDKAGNDLQWIRINGSMIGGVVGLILFLFLDLIYAPYIGPALMTVMTQLYR